MSRVMLSVLGGLGLTQVNLVKPVRFGAATELVGRVYREVERDFGVLAPPIALHSPAPGPLAATWLMLRETLLVPGLVDRPAKEAMATAVSVTNSCPFCVTVHSGTYDVMSEGRDATALAEGRIDAIQDPGVRANAAWASASASAESAARQQVPFTAGQAPESVGLTVMMQYLNRMVNVFLREAPLPPGVPTAALGGVMAVLGGLMRSASRKPREAGASLDLLPSAPLPADLRWAEGNASIAGAFARAAAAFEAAGANTVPDAVRELVTAELAGWRGEPRGPSRAWAEEAVTGLPVGERPAGRLALLVALGSHQVDRAVIGEFRRDRPDDATLVELASWAAMAAARRAGSWARFDPAVPVLDSGKGTR